MDKKPPVSILIVTLNSARTFKKCLEYIKQQTYPNISEVLIVDGGSSDQTLQLAKESGLPVRIINGGYRDNQEARRGVGVKSIKNNICAMIDSDNYITDKDWVEDMVEPLVENKEVIASQTLRYSAPKNTTVFNRYFGLLGAADPMAYYLGKADRLSWAFDKWNLRGTIIKDFGKYFIVEFNPDKFLSVGCNGIVFKKDMLLKSDWGNPENFVHADVYVDVARLGYTKFAIVKNEIFHNTAENILNFFIKRRNYMLLHHKKLNSKRRFKVFDSNQKDDWINLLLFMILSVTLIEPIFESLRGYYKKRDIAWFLHPVICLGIMTVYSEAIIQSTIFKKKK